jgi:hypothetical protein
MGIQRRSEAAILAAGEEFGIHSRRENVSHSCLNRMAPSPLPAIYQATNDPSVNGTGKATKRPHHSAAAFILPMSPITIDTLRSAMLRQVRSRLWDVHRWKRGLNTITKKVVDLNADDFARVFDRWPAAKETFRSTPSAAGKLANLYDRVHSGEEAVGLSTYTGYTYNGAR